jgi:hypothetical protein
VSTVLMRHPGLPPEQEIEVDEAALPHYTGAGWQQVPAKELEARAARKAKADAEARAAAEGDVAAAEPEPAEPTTERPARTRAKAHEKNAEEN